MRSDTAAKLKRAAATRGALVVAAVSKYRCARWDLVGKSAHKSAVGYSDIRTFLFNKKRGGAALAAAVREAGAKYVVVAAHHGTADGRIAIASGESFIPLSSFLKTLLPILAGGETIYLQVCYLGLALGALCAALNGDASLCAAMKSTGVGERNWAVVGYDCELVNPGKKPGTTGWDLIEEDIFVRTGCARGSAPLSAILLRLKWDGASFVQLGCGKARHGARR
jgi:hypothetical protein